MQIWAFFKNGTPQHIGNTDGMASTADLIAGAHKARHSTIKFACRAIKGNKVDVYMFDDEDNMTDFMTRNADITFTEKAAA